MKPGAVLRVVAAAALAAAGVGAAAVPASAGGVPIIQIDVVVNGTPTGPIEVIRTCTGNPGNASAPVTATQTAILTGSLVGLVGISCTVTATQPADTTASFVCATMPSSLSCAADSTSATMTKAQANGGTGVITVTFDVAPPTPGESTAAAPLVAAPTSTG